MLVMPAALTALNAYSVDHKLLSVTQLVKIEQNAEPKTQRDLTDLVQSTFWAEDGDVPIITTASPRHGECDNSADDTLGKNYCAIYNNATVQPL